MISVFKAQNHDLYSKSSNHHNSFLTNTTVEFRSLSLQQSSKEKSMKKHDTDCAYIQFNYLRITIRGGSNFVDFMDHLHPRINTHDEKRKKGNFIFNHSCKFWNPPPLWKFRKPRNTVPWMFKELDGRSQYRLNISPCIKVLQLILRIKYLDFFFT